MTLPYPNISAAAAVRTPVNVGFVANDNTGDALRTAFTRNNARDAGLEVGLDQAKSNFDSLEARTTSLEGSALFFNWRGDWATATAYVYTPGVRRDIFRDAATGDVYVVLQSHTSGSLAADEAAGRIVLNTDQGRADMVNFNWTPPVLNENKVDWGLHTARSGISLLRFVNPVHWPDVLAGVSTVDLSYAFTAAMLYFSTNGGGTLQIPPGQYTITGTVYCDTSGVEILGAGAAATVIRYTGTGSAFEFASTHFSGVKSLQILHTNNASTGYAVRFIKTETTGCFFSFAKDLYIVNPFNGIEILTCTETRVSGIHLRSARGDYGIRFRGTGSGFDGSYRAVISDVVCDVAGNGNTVIKWICHDSWAYSLVVSKVTGLYGGVALVMQDTANTGSSYPIWCFAEDLEADHNSLAGVLLFSGEGFFCVHSWIGSTTAGSGVVVDAGFRGEVSLTSSRVMGCYFHGVLIQAGPVNVRISGCMIGDNGVQAPNVHHGIAVVGGASRFFITNNTIGDLPGVAGNSQAYGIFLLAGATTDYIISDNELTGNMTGAIDDGSTGTNGLISKNLGYEPAPSNVTVTASPMVYRAGHTEESLFVRGGTVLAIQSPTGVLYYSNTTNVCMPLAPNQQVVIIYTAAPSISRAPK
jgi:hypothetical protein